MVAQRVFADVQPLGQYLAGCGGVGTDRGHDLLLAGGELLHTFALRIERLSLVLCQRKKNAPSGLAIDPQFAGQNTLHCL